MVFFCYGFKSSRWTEHLLSLQHAKLLDLLTCLVLLKLLYLMYHWFLTRFAILFFSKNLSFSEFMAKFQPLSIFNSRWLHVVMHGKSLKECLKNELVPQGSIFSLILTLLFSNLYGIGLQV